MLSSLLRHLLLLLLLSLTLLQTPIVLCTLPSSFALELDEKFFVRQQ